MIVTMGELLDWISEVREEEKKGAQEKLDIGVVSGGFDPIHKGHVQYLLDAFLRCEFLIVIVNGDSFLQRKKGFRFMDAEERAFIVDNIKGVDQTIIYTSESDTVDEPLALIKPDKFFKGGDRTGPDNIPEWSTCVKYGIAVITGVGGNKIQSSSDLVKRIR